MSTPRRLVIGISGASGAMLGLRIIEVARAAAGWEIHLVVSRAAERTIAHEVGAKALTQLVDTVDKRHDVDDVGASIASGSFRTEAMIVAPCSMRSLGAIASSVSDNLLTRAAEVHLKERRRLVLMARETPLHLGHLRAMVKVTEMGAIVMPPVPAFYAKPASVNDYVDQLAHRALALALPEGRFAGFEWTG